MTAVEAVEPQTVSMTDSAELQDVADAAAQRLRAALDRPHYERGLLMVHLSLA